MTLTDVDRELPNGFHDAYLLRLAADYAKATLTLDLNLWIGDTGRPNAGRARALQARPHPDRGTVLVRHGAARFDRARKPARVPDRRRTGVRPRDAAEAAGAAARRLFVVVLRPRVEHLALRRRPVGGARVENLRPLSGG